MTLREANYEIEKLNNELNKLLKDKALLESTIDPKSIDYTKILVDGGVHNTNIQEIYVLTKELDKYKNLDKRINNIQEEIFNYTEWIDKELKILKKYDKVEQLIVYYKEDSIKKYTWYQIANKVHYSKDYCRKIYMRYKKKRNIKR